MGYLNKDNDSKVGTMVGGEHFYGRQHITMKYHVMAAFNYIIPPASPSLDGWLP